MKVNPTSAMAVPKHTGVLVNQKTVDSPNLKQLRNNCGLQLSPSYSCMGKSLGLQDSFYKHV